MGMDLGRGSGGRAPFLVLGLILICVFLVFNWWSLSTQNLELFRRFEERGEHLKLGSRKVVECNQIKLELEKELSSVKQQIADKNVEFDEANSQCEKVKKERDLNADSTSRCHVELESIKKVRLSQDVLIESRREEKEHLESELKEKKAEISRLSAELRDVQEKLNQKTAQAKQVVEAPVKEENSPLNHEGRNAVDVAEAAINNAQEQADETENKDTDNAIEDQREKEQERMGEKNTADVPRSK